MFLLRSDGDSASPGACETEAHHRFIDGADLLDIERAVGDALAIEEEEALEEAEDGAVGNQRDLRLWIFDGRFLIV